MSKEIAIVCIVGRTITVTAPNKEPEHFSAGGNIFSRTPVNIKLREVLSNLYSQGYAIETSNAFQSCHTYVLAK